MTTAISCRFWVVQAKDQSSTAWLDCIPMKREESEGRRLFEQITVANQTVGREHRLVRRTITDEVVSHHLAEPGTQW